MNLSRQLVQEQINRLISTFGDSAFKAEKLRRIYSNLETLPDNGVREVVDEVIDSSRYAPTPTEIKEKVNLWRRKHGFHDQEKTILVDPIRCTKCYDCGYVFLKVNARAEVTVCCCKCDAGDRKFHHESEIIGSSIPQLEDNFIRMGMLIQEFKHEWFRPESGEVKDRANVIERWQKFLVKNRHYWRTTAGKDLANQEKTQTL
jgi:hypothetical protein